MQSADTGRELLIAELEALRRRVDELGKSKVECKQVEEKLLKTVNDPERSNRLVVGREQQMIELKRLVNDLLHSIGRQGKYRISTSENVKNKRGA